MEKENYKYEVLNPWPDAELPPLKSIAPRLETLDGKTIGLLCNFKLSARPILTVIERKLKERFPALKTIWYGAKLTSAWREYFGRDKDPVDPKFRDWVNMVDAVVSAVGD